LLCYTVEKFSLYITITLCSADNYDVIENAVFTVSEVKKANSVSNNNFTKFERTFIIFGKQHLKSNAQLTVY